jgi:signal transduction histidine kinase
MSLDIRQLREARPRGSTAVLTIENSGEEMRQTGRLNFIYEIKPFSGKEGLGLVTMRERLQQIGGQLDVESKPRATHIRTIVPLRVKTHSTDQI